MGNNCGNICQTLKEIQNQYSPSQSSEPLILFSWFDHIRDLKEFWISPSYIEALRKNEKDYDQLWQLTDEEQMEEKVQELAKSNLRIESEVKGDHVRTLNVAQILFCKEFNLNKLQCSFENIEEVKEVSRKVKQACREDMNAFMLFSMYLLECTKNMSKEGKTVEKIEKKLTKTLKEMRKLHPPNTNKPAGTEIQDIKSVKNDDDKNNERFLDLSICKKEEKIIELEKFIISFASKAKINTPNLIDLVKESCMKNNGKQFKVGVKINDSKSQSAIDRVKEKLFFENFKDFKLFGFPEGQKDIIKCFTDEKVEFNKQLGQFLSESSKEIEFTVSDMLRGKCMFEKVSEINSASQSIKQNCERKGFKIVEIDNRLDQKTTDLVFKIDINGVISEFQLVYEFNFVQNEYNHKIYELVRSKFFTNILTLNEFNKIGQRKMLQFCEMLSATAKMSQDIRGERNMSENETCQNLESEMSKWVNKNYQVSVPKIITEVKNEENMTFFERERKQNNQQKQEYLYLSALYFMKSQKFDKVQEISLKILKKQKQAKIQNENEIKYLQKSLKIKIVLSDLYSERGNIDEALKYYDECLQIQQRVKGKDSIDYADTMNNIGSVYYSKGDYVQALKYYDECLQITQRVKGKDSIDCASTLNNIGLVYDNKGDYVQALKYYDECLQIQQRVKGKDSIDCADTMNNIGLVYDNKGDYVQALKYYDECLQIQQRVKGKDSIDYADTMNNIGSVYSSKGDYVQALKYYDECLQIKQRVKGKDSIDYADTMNNIGSVYYSKGDYVQALKYYDECLQITQRVKGKDSIDCASTLNNIGLVYDNKGDYVQALKYYDECLQIQQRVKGKDSIDYADTMNNIGSVYSSKGDYVQALKYYDECLQIQQRVKGKDSIDCASTLNNIGSVYDSKGDYVQALKYYDECLQIKQRVKGKDSIDCASTLNNIGLAYDNKGDYVQALKYYDEAFIIIKSLPNSENHPNYNLFQSQINSVKSRMK